MSSAGSVEAGERVRVGRSYGCARLCQLPRAEKPRRASGRVSDELFIESKSRCLDRHLVVMVKAPTMGRVKTRLARGIGAARATSFYRTVTNNVLARVSCERRWNTYLAISPDAEVDTRTWPNSAVGSDVSRFAQGGGDLGCRMQRILDGMPPGPVVIVGSDIPMIASGHIAHAFHRLGGAHAVIGPSPDGGYWLFGMARRRRVVRAFERVVWSSRLTMSSTLANFRGLTVARVLELGDIDDQSDLVEMGAGATRRVLPA